MILASLNQCTAKSDFAGTLLAFFEELNALFGMEGLFLQTVVFRATTCIWVHSSHYLWLESDVQIFDSFETSVSVLIM